MEKVSIQIFTSPTCQYCPPVLELVKKIGKEREDVDVKEHNVMTSEGKQKAIQYGIQGTPTVLVSYPGHGETLGYTSPSRHDLIEAIDVVSGKKELPKPKGIFQALKKFID